jgi:hypothetical protein
MESSYRKYRVSRHGFAKFIKRNNTSDCEKSFYILMGLLYKSLMMMMMMMRRRRRRRRLAPFPICPQ